MLCLEKKSLLFVAKLFGTVDLVFLIDEFLPTRNCLNNLIIIFSK